MIEDLPSYKKKCESMLSDGNLLEQMRAEQMIILANEGEIKGSVPEQVAMTLDTIMVNDLNTFRVSFLDGTEITVQI